MDIYWAYAKHEQEILDAIDYLVDCHRRGLDEATLKLDDDFSDEEIQYIINAYQQKVRQ